MNNTMESMKVMHKRLSQPPLPSFNVGIMILVVVISFVREPMFFLMPRLWAEEGAVYLQSAVDGTWWDALLAPHLGYYSLIPNVLGVCGLNVVGLDEVASITTWGSFVCMMYCILAPLVLRSDYWSTRIAKVGVVMTSLCVGSAEIWLNTINVQFFFCLFSCFVLMSDLGRADVLRKTYVIAGMVLASLSGATSVILLPLFLYRYVNDKEAGSLLRHVVSILCFGLVVQLLGMYHSVSVDGASRLQLSNLTRFIPGLVRTMSGIANAGDIYARIVFVMTVTVCTVPMLRTIPPLRVPLGIALYVGMVFTFFSLQMNGGNRYAFVPSVMMMIAVIHALERTPVAVHKSLGIMMLCAVVLRVAAAFVDTSGYYDARWTLHHQPFVDTRRHSVEVRVFPQWPRTHWVLRMSDTQYERYKK